MIPCSVARLLRSSSTHARFSHRLSPVLWQCAGSAVSASRAFAHGRRNKKPRKKKLVPVSEPPEQPRYRPKQPPAPLPIGHPLKATYFEFWDPETEHFTFNATTRAKHEIGTSRSRAMRNLDKIPAIIITNESKDGATNWENAVRCTLPRKEMEALERSGNIWNRIIMVNVHDQETGELIETVKTITSIYHWRGYDEKPMNLVLLRWNDKKKGKKICVPVRYDNWEDSETIKKGGLLRDMNYPWGIECYWHGKDVLPKFIKIDLMHTRIGYVYHLAQELMPKNLTLRRHRDMPRPVLATIQGKLRRGDEVEDAVE